MVAMAFQRGGSGGGRGRGRGGGAGRGQQHATEVTAGGSRAPQTYEEYRDMPCLAHLDPVTGKSTHTNRNCKWVNDLKNDPEAGYKRARKHRPRGKGGKGKNKDKEEDSSEAMDEDDNSPDPKAGSAVPAVPQYVRWSEIPCTFDWKDHPAIVPKECYALVVSPRIDGCHLPTYDAAVLKDQIGRNVHAYVDDIAVMTRKGSDLISDLTKPSTTSAAISRFVSRLGEKALPLYKLLKKTDKFVWDDAADAALRGLKEILTSPPILAATNKVISVVIVVERKEEGHEYDVQRPVYYISEVRESKQRYPHFQKLAYGVFLGSRKLRHYFQEHPLSYFVADWTEAPDASLEPEPKHGSCTSMDQAASRLGSRSHPEVPYRSCDVLQIHFEATNNMAEYEALLHGAKEIGIKHIICCGDSDLVAQQVAGTWNARNSVMAAYRDEVDEIAKCFLGYEVKYVRRDDNTAADMLSKLGSGRKQIPPGIFLEHLRIPSVKGANPENPEVAVSPAREVMAIIPAWTQPFLDYLIDQKLPEDEVLARQIVRRARSYTIVDGQLYK
ncbi:hypothetical protein QYE76_056642 [Lolium multiflorum]|uniref:RNase H type-1 domain-containing protein n=1 Tax=Lolium multiflorum TaxID=4521 RepID=A0AAD8WQ20_LOLMU|nr:hypothetical protein QYE76_056642 [Lolium multiflorum]